MPLTDEDKAWIKDALAELRTEMKADLEKVETNLLTAFHQWASPVDMRMRAHNATLRALDAEQEALADRVKKLEGAA